jgi:hypothetical protein
VRIKGAGIAARKDDVMKVEGPRPIETVRSTRARTGTSASGQVLFVPEETAEPHAAVSLSSTAPLATVDALIALQEMPDATAGRAKAAKRGRDMLDLLDDLRHGILTGGVSRATLQRLVALVNVDREDFVDSGLAEVLDDIELRARVELAKLNFAAAP